MSIDFRAIILRRLREIKKSKYWLCEQLQFDPGRNTVYAYLRGERDIHAHHVARILEVLSLEVSVKKNTL